MFNTARIEAGSTVAIIGCGGVGLAAVAGAALAGASRILALDTLPAKLELARSMGATNTVLVGNENPVEQVLELTGAVCTTASNAWVSRPTAEQSSPCCAPAAPRRSSA